MSLLYENKVIEESIAYINENISDKLQLSGYRGSLLCAKFP